MAVFGIPRVHEDDAAPRRARRRRDARGAARAQRGARAHVGRRARRRAPGSTRARSSRVTGGAARSSILGDPVNVAARLEQAAEPGEILLGEATYRLVRDAVSASSVGPLQVKGKPEPLEAWRAARGRPGASGWARNLASALVGRDRELALLESVFARVTDAGSCEVVTVVRPGRGGQVAPQPRARRAARRPTRRSSRGAACPTARASRSGRSRRRSWTRPASPSATGPRRRGARSRPCSAPTRTPRSSPSGSRPLLGVDPGRAAIQETFWAVRKLFEHLGTRAPARRRLRRHPVGRADVPRPARVPRRLAARRAGAAALPRPAGAARGPARVGDRRRRTRPLITLAAADRGRDRRPDPGPARGRRARARTPGRASPSSPRATRCSSSRRCGCSSTTALLERRDGRWAATGDLSEITIPPTIHALLTARLDRLDAGRARGDRARVGRRARVLVGGGGRDLRRRGAPARHPAPAVADPQGADPARLLRRPAARPRSASATSSSATPPTRASRRRSGPSCTSASPTGSRSRRATWRASSRRSSATTSSRRGGCCSRWRPLGERPDALGRRAATILAAAGARAFDRGDMPAAVNLLSRAAGLLAGGHARARRASWPSSRSRCSRPVTSTASRRSSAETTAAATAADAPDLQPYAAIIAAVGPARPRNPEGWAAEAEEEATQAIAAFAAAGDERGLAKAWALLGLLHIERAEFRAAEDAWTRAAEHAPPARRPPRRAREPVLGAARRLGRPDARRPRACAAAPRSSPGRRATRR